MKIEIYWGKNKEPFVCKDFYDMKQRFEELYECSNFREFKVTLKDEIEDIVIKEKKNEKENIDVHG